MRRAAAILASATLLGTFALAAAPGSAGAAISIYESSEAATLKGTVSKLDCRLARKGKSFFAEGKTTNGRYKLVVDIHFFDGFGTEYPVPFGVINPTVNVEGIGTPEDYANNYPFPGGMPPPASGAIAFSKKGKRLGIGIYALPNTDYSAGVVLAGGAPCDYPNKKKKKKGKKKK
jgi:hypothetical protein